jgi:molybdopterin-guanine dinucleotide biosynthesis protein A
LTGLYSVLRHLVDHDQETRLLLCPCDAPFVPETLAWDLHAAGKTDQEAVVLVSWQQVIQPTFSLWHTNHTEIIGEAVDEGVGGLKQVLDRLPYLVLEWNEVVPPPFFNVNTPEDLALARRWLDPRHP